MSRAGGEQSDGAEGMKKALIAIMVMLGLMAYAIPSHTFAAETTQSKKAAKSPEVQKAQKLYNKGKYEEALKILKEHVKTNPEPDAYYLIAYSLYKLGRHDEAAKYFKDSYLVSPEYTPTPSIEEKLQKPYKDARPTEEMLKQAETGTYVPPAQTADGIVVERPSTLVVPKRDEKAPTVEQQKPVEQAKQETPASTPAPAPTSASTPAPTPAPVPAASQPDVAPLPQAEPERAPMPEPAEEPAPRPRTVPAPPISDEQAGLAILALLGAFLLPVIAFVVFFYLFFCFCLFKIAKKLGLESPWTIFSFIPILQTLTFIKASGKPLWFIVLLLVPFVNLFVGIYLWMCITENLGKNKMLALLLIVPVVNLGFLGYLAFGKGDGAKSAASAAAAADMDMMGGEPDLDLPDVSDLGDDFGADDFGGVTDLGGDKAGAKGDDFDMGGFGSSEGVGGGDEFDAGFGSEDSFGDDEFDADDEDKG